MGCSQSKRPSQSINQKLPSLYNYKLKGEWEEDAKAIYDEQSKFLKQNPNFELTEEVLPHVRQAQLQVSEKFKGEEYTKFSDQCQAQNHKINGTKYGSDNEQLLVISIKVKQNLAKHKNPCIIYSHGGAAVYLDAEHYTPLLSRIAVQCNATVLNVDFRLAPQNKAPKGILDTYSTVKWARDNAEVLGIDPHRICVMGESGGGYISAGVGIKLVQMGEQDLIKLMIPIIPMVGDYYLSVPSQKMNEMERPLKAFHQGVFKFLAEDPEKQRRDPYIFPNFMSKAVAKKFPLTVIFSTEFDMYYHPTMDMANLLRKEGRLLDLCVHPGVQHAHFFRYEIKSSATFYKDLAKATNKWL